jgi:hypothetical protein
VLAPTTVFLRSDWRESIPIVYEHIFSNISYTNTTGNIVNANATVEVDSGNVSALPSYDELSEKFPLWNSSCFGWNNYTQEGFCHGVSWQNTTDGYYAFSNKSADFNLTRESFYPYYYNAPVDWLPDTTNCTYCHLGSDSVRLQWGNATNISASNANRNHTSIDTVSESKCWECHEDTGSEPTNFHALSVNNGTGGPDCVACHDIGKSDAPDVDVSKMNLSSSSIHNNMSRKNTNPNTTILTQEVDKACWACHGDGTQPQGHPSNYKNPWNCSDCHTNKTGGYNSTTGLGNYSAPLVLQHLNATDGSYYDALTFNITINTTVQCEYCHNNSVAATGDTEFSSLGHTERSNISHYGTNESLDPGGNATTDCTTCHMNSTIALQWGLQNKSITSIINYTIRHGEDNATFCGKCHNSTSADNLHAEKLFKPFYVHQRYDWEDDDDNEDKNGGGQAFKQESCYACHNETQVTDLYPSKNCEDCHLNNSVGPYNRSPCPLSTSTSSQT